MKKELADGNKREFTEGAAMVRAGRPVLAAMHLLFSLPGRFGVAIDRDVGLPFGDDVLYSAFSRKCYHSIVLVLAKDVGWLWHPERWRHG